MKNIILTTFLLLVGTSSFSQKLAPITTMKQLSDSIAAIVEREHISGLMLGITTKDSVLFSGGFGYADILTKRNVDEHTLFRMGSITKMFVSLGIMKLVSEGKLSLNDELKKIAPEVPFQNKWEATNPVLIINLLEHTSGFDDIKLNRMYCLGGEEAKGIDRVMIHKNSMVCRWKPSERFAYSNPNYTILGYLIEKMTGMSYSDYLTRNILAPIGMTNSNFNVGSKYPQREAKEYIVENGQTIPVKSVTLLSGPVGGLWSSSSDMLKFLQLFLRKGSPIFPPDIITEIETTHSSLAAQFGQKNGYSLGNENGFFATAKYPFRGHNGLLGTFFSSCKYNYELGVGYIISSNCNKDNEDIERLIVKYLEQNLPNSPLLAQAIDKERIKPFLGRYQFESPRNEISAFSDKLQNAPELYFKNDKLYLKPLIGDALELVQTTPMIFAWKDRNMPTICLTKNAAGKNVLLIEGSYFEQVSNFWAIFKRLTMVIALLFALSAILFSLFSISNFFRQKLSWQTLIPRILPLIGVSFLAWSVHYLLEIEKYTYKLSELATFNFKTFLIFSGTSIFGITSIVSLFYAIQRFPKEQNRWLGYYLLLVSISLSFIAAILWENGWIGLRTWAL